MLQHNLSQYISNTQRTAMRRVWMQNSIRWCVVAVIVLAIFPLARPALADPHAMFYTDRAQEQLFYNVLAALNQADYVEPPYGYQGAPPIKGLQREGETITTGRPPSSQSTVNFERDSDGNLISRNPPLEPDEQEDLPRIRARIVTADDGDVYYREQLRHRATMEAQRVDLTNLICMFRQLYWGTEKTQDQCVKETLEGDLDLTRQ